MNKLHLDSQDGDDEINDETVMFFLKDEQIETYVNRCKSIEEIVTLVEKIGGVHGTKQFFTPILFKEVICGVLDGTYPVIQVTRTHGFRDKVTEILRQSNVNKTISKNHNSQNYSNNKCPELGVMI